MNIAATIKLYFSSHKLLYAANQFFKSGNRWSSNCLSSSSSSSSSSSGGVGGGGGSSSSSSNNSKLLKHQTDPHS